MPVLAILQAALHPASLALPAFRLENSMMHAATSGSEVELLFLVSREGVARVIDVPLGRYAVARTSTQARPGPFEGNSSKSTIGVQVRLEGDDSDVVAVTFDQDGSTARTVKVSPLRKGSGRKKHVEPEAPKAKAATIPEGATALEGFILVARDCLAQVSANARLLRDVRNPEALHQMRVGLRRLRAAFTTFSPILPPEGLDRQQHETEWLSGELEPARDLDVFIKNEFSSAKARAPADPTMAVFGERLRLAQCLAYDQALVAVDSNRFRAFLLDCAEWVEAVSWQPDVSPTVMGLRDGDASILAVQALQRLRRHVCKIGKNLATLDRVGRHEVRIKAKKLRYAGEFFARTFSGSARKQYLKFIASLAALQDALGDLNDMATARRSALAVAGRSPELAFRAGLVVGGRDRDEPRLLAVAVRAYARWAGARPFWH